MRISSVTRIDGPTEDGQFFMVTRYDGLIGWLRGRKLFAVVRWNGDLESPHVTWGTTDEIVHHRVFFAVTAHIRRCEREAYDARIRGDRHWQSLASDALQVRSLSSGGEP